MTRKPFVTPASIPETVQCRTLQIPDDPAILGIVNAALIQLIYANNYEQINETDASPQDIASRMLTMVWDYFNSGSECMGYCDQILACLRDDPDVRNEIFNIIYGDGGTITGQPYPGIDLLVIEPPYPTCDDDDRYGLCFKIVDTLHVASMDFLETLLLLTEIAEVANELLSLLPVLGPWIDVLTQIATYTVNIGIASYQAAYTTTIQEAIACNLFCYLDTECSLSVADLQYVYSQLAADLSPPGPTATITDVALFFAGLITLSDFQVVATMHLLILELWRRGIDVAGNSARLLQIASSLAVPVTAPDCGCCETPDWLYDWYNADPDNLDDWSLLLSGDIAPSNPNALNDPSGSYERTLYDGGDGHYYLRGHGFLNTHQGVGIKRDIPDTNCRLVSVAFKLASGSPTCRVGVKVWTYTTSGGWVFAGSVENDGTACPGTSPLEGVVSVGVDGAEKVAIIAYSDVDCYIWSLQFTFTSVLG